MDSWSICRSRMYIILLSILLFAYIMKVINKFNHTFMLASDHNKELGNQDVLVRTEVFFEVDEYLSYKKIITF